MRVWAVALMIAAVAGCRQTALRLPPLQMRTLAPGPATAVGMLGDGAILAGSGDTLWVARRDGATASVAVDYGTLRLRLRDVRAIAAGRDGRVAIADPDSNRIWEFKQTGTDVSGAVLATLRSLAGSGTALYPIGDGGAAISAQLDAPRGAAWFPNGDLAIADTGHGRVRLVGGDGRIATLAGTGLSGALGDGGPAAKATLLAPGPLAAAPDGSLLLAETGAPRVRRIAADGQIATFSGDRVSALAVSAEGLVLAAIGREIRTIGPEGGQVAAAGLQGPVGLAVAGDGAVVVADGDRVVLLEPGRK